jgi:hypothetical protein
MTICVRSGWIGDCSGWLYRQATKMEQMMEHLVATIEKMETNQERMEAKIGS